MKDCKHIEDEEIRDQTLKMQEEAHYHHTINDVVELMVVYGQLNVLMDITARMKEIDK